MTRLALLLLVVAACGPSSPPAPPSNTGGGSFDERQACTVDSDCTMIELGCCDHCNGGHAVGVHKDHFDEVRAAYPPDCADDVIACTEMACEAPSPFCSNGICGLRFGTREQVDPLPRP